MKKLFMSFLALIMMMGSITMVSAQDSTPVADDDAASGDGTAYASGLDAPATYFSDRGQEVATVSVVDVERGWQDYSDYSAPDPGVEYVAVTFEVENLSGSNMIIEPYDFTLLDSMGRNNSRGYVSVEEGVEIFEDDVAIASGETVEVVAIFSLFEDVDASIFMWQPDSGIIVMVNVAD